MYHCSLQTITNFCEASSRVPIELTCEERLSSVDCQGTARTCDHAGRIGSHEQTTVELTWDLTEASSRL